MHDALGVEFPVLVAVGAKPLSGIVVRFGGEAHGNPCAVERPQFFDEPILQLTIPFARQELNDFLAAVDEFRAMAPTAVHRVSQRNFLWVARIPAVFGFAHFLYGGLAGEGWHQSNLRLSSHFVSPFLLRRRDTGR